MWSHKKYKELFTGSYGYLKKDRVFQLTSQSGKKVISFESFQQAKKQGWTK
jgi:hypothetical protein